MFPLSEFSQSVFFSLKHALHTNKLYQIKQNKMILSRFIRKHLLTVFGKVKCSSLDCKLELKDHHMQMFLRHISCSGLNVSIAQINIRSFCFFSQYTKAQHSSNLLCLRVTEKTFQMSFYFLRLRVTQKTWQLLFQFLKTFSSSLLPSHHCFWTDWQIFYKKFTSAFLVDMCNQNRESFIGHTDKLLCLRPEISCV